MPGLIDSHTHILLQPEDECALPPGRTSKRGSRPGKFADVIAVEGNPLEDIGALGRVSFVMKSGEVYKSPR